MNIVARLRNRVPFVRSPREVLPEVLAALELPASGELWDLGCGDGRVLVAVRRARPDLRLVGVEHSWRLAMVARSRLRPSDRVVRGKILDVSLSGVDRVFAYLGPSLMAELDPKFEAELPTGARVVTMQYALPNRRPVREVPLSHGPAFANRLFVYEY